MDNNKQKTQFVGVFLQSVSITTVCKSHWLILFFRKKKKDKDKDREKLGKTLAITDNAEINNDVTSSKRSKKTKAELAYERSKEKRVS